MDPELAEEFARILTPYLDYDQPCGPPTVSVRNHGVGQYVMVLRSSKGEYLGTVYIKDDAVHEDTHLGIDAAEGSHA